MELNNEEVFHTLSGAVTYRGGFDANEVLARESARGLEADLTACRHGK